ncbi:SDR family NAD(P)-dependent oxidoreductase [Ktedonospora formicarum]|uniref:Uncharacterized protein n=1 Tax=Ktedonospora formicarum TaxID=2778364 RepID=A0A8J3HYZ0_9CHLR|nr:SDR family NAD(P)-dependent oxidoreductase [Ktedonospora formicarum]GHO45741.1 hypothetical protein KSX_39040 [Ktedonospora formicarum]
MPRSCKLISAQLRGTVSSGQALTKLGAIDILVNNAAATQQLFHATGLQAIEDAEWQQAFNVNVLAAVRLDKALLPRMLVKKEKGEKNIWLL